MSRLVQIWLLFLLIFFTACGSSWRAGSVAYDFYRLDSSDKKDTVMETIIRPYGESVNAQMNEIVGTCEIALENKLPEGSLGNFMTDAMLEMAKRNYRQHVDAAFMNYGGIRINQLPEGNITRGKIFELMPFDNLLLIQKVNGKVLKDFLDHIAGRGGWPVAGLTMRISNKKAVDIRIGGAALDEDKEYVIANSDYIVNGGDGVNMLRNIPVQNKGYLVRDALFDYIRLLKEGGKNIYAEKENRVTYAQ